MKLVLWILLVLFFSGCSSEKKFTLKIYEKNYTDKNGFQNSYHNSYKVNYKLLKPDGSIINKKINQCCFFSEDIYGKEIECSAEGYDLTLELWVNDKLQNKEIINNGETKLSYK